jgi:hypothetical protein
MPSSCEARRRSAGADGSRPESHRQHRADELDEPLEKECRRDEPDLGRPDEHEQRGQEANTAGGEQDRRLLDDALARDEDEREDLREARQHSAREKQDEHGLERLGLEQGSTEPRGEDDEKEQRG